MIKNISTLIIPFVVGILVIVACMPTQGLEGGAGGGGGDDGGSQGGGGGGDQVGGGGGGDQVGGGGGDQGGGGNPNSANNALIVEFYAPTYTVIISSDGASTTGLSIPPIGTAKYQLTTPKEMQLGNEYHIELILVPSIIQIEENIEGNLMQAFRGEIDIYPQMSAELIAGATFSISPYITKVSLINENNVNNWKWYLIASQPGKHELEVAISVPVLAEGNVTNFDLAHLPFAVSVFSPTLTPPLPTPTSTLTPTFTPSPTPPPNPTNTPIPSIGEQLSGSATQISIALIGAVATILAAVIAVIWQKDKSAREKKASRAESEKKKIEEGIRKTKDTLFTNENTRKEKDQIERSKKGKQK